MPTVLLQVNKQSEITRRHFLTIDGESDLGLPDADPRDDGLAYVLAGVSLAHWIQKQLVAVTQNLCGSGEKQYTNINKAMVLSKWEGKKNKE